MQILESIALVLITGFALFTMYVMVLYPLYRIVTDLWDEKLGNRD